MKLTLMMLLCILMLGCATTLTEEEAIKACPEQEEECLVVALEKKVEQEEYDRAERLILYQDEYRAMKQWCTGPNSVLEKYSCPIRQRREQRRTGLCIPTHRTDKFYCVNTRELLRDIERQMRY